MKFPRSFVGASWKEHLDLLVKVSTEQLGEDSAVNDTEKYKATIDKACEECRRYTTFRESVAL